MTSAHAWLVVPWRELERWDYLSNFQRHRMKCAYPLATTGDVMTIRRQLATEQEFSSGAVRMLDRVSFDGEIFAGERQKTKMDQWIAEPGDIVVSKIRARQGSIGLVEPGQGKVSVTIHYRVLTPNSKRIDAKYAHLAMRSTFGKVQFLAATGGAMKGEISEDALLKIQIPLPSLPVQKKIVTAWEAAQTVAVSTAAKIEQLERDIEARFLTDLGIENRLFSRRPKCFTMPWHLAERWSVEFLTRKALGLSEANKGKYYTKPLSLLAKGVSGSTPSKGDSHFWGGSVPWVSPKDMKTDIIIDSMDYITEEAIQKRMAPLVPANSILVVMRSGILQRTVPVALADLPVSINQDMRAFVVKDRAVLLPSFLATYLQCRQADLLKLVKWSTTVQSINSEELEAFPIPLPTLPTQQQIVEKVAKRREEIAKLKAEAKGRADAAKEDMEAMILGTKKVGAP